MSVILSHRMPTKRISVLAVLFLFSIAPRHLPNAYAQVSDLTISDGAEVEVPAEDPANIDPGAAARPKPVIPNRLEPGTAPSAAVPSAAEPYSS